MPVAPADTYRIKDYDQLNDPAKLLDTVLEVESGSGVDKNYKITFPTVIQTVANNLPGTNRIKSAYKAVRTYDTLTPGYQVGFDTLVGLDSDTLCVGSLARVEFPSPARDYILVFDPNSSLYVYTDGSFLGQKQPARWVEKNSLDNLTSAINDFNPFQAAYKKGDNVKYTLNGALRIFTAKLYLVKSTFTTNQIPAPTGLATDANWLEISADAAPNHSRLGQITTRFYHNSERDIYGGDSVEDLIARENAGAGILYTNRTVNVELGPNAGTYRVVYNATTPTFTAWSDGSFLGGRNPSSLEKVAQGGVTQAYVDAADAFLQSQLITEKNRMDALVTGAPAALDTLKEIADQLAADDASAASMLATIRQHSQQLVNVVHRTSDESIAGIKTFTDAVESPFYVIGGRKLARYNNNYIILGYGDNGTSLNFEGNYFNWQTPGTGRGMYLDNYGNLRTDGNVQATQFVGDGSLLTGIPKLAVEQDLTSNSTTAVPSVAVAGKIVQFYTRSSNFPASADASQTSLYVARNANKIYRFDGTAYQEIAQLPLVQTAGASTTSVMSQNAVTTAIGQMSFKNMSSGTLAGPYESGTWYRFNSSNNLEFTIYPEVNSATVVGNHFFIEQVGSGTINVVPRVVNGINAPAPTLRLIGCNAYTAGVGSILHLMKVASDVWIMYPVVASGGSGVTIEQNLSSNSTTSVPSVKAVADAISAGQGSGTSGSTIATFPEYTATTSGAQSITLPTTGTDAFAVVVYETSGLTRTIYPGNYNVSSTVLTINANASIKAGDKIMGNYYK